MSLCLCGCGKETPIAKKTNTKKGLIKGHPAHYCHNHHRKYSLETHPRWNGGKTIIRGYIGIKTPGHPRANDKGYVYEQIIVAEKVLGKPLPKGALVHHINENPSDNRNENLVICEGTSYHQFLHMRTKKLRAVPSSSLASTGKRRAA